VADTTILSICEKGDAYLLSETKKVYNKAKGMEKGVYSC
jgi:hypothetical protein